MMRLASMLPELTLLLGLVVVLLAPLFIRRTNECDACRGTVAFVITQLALAVALILSVLGLGSDLTLAAQGLPYLLTTPLNALMQGAVLIVAMLALFYARGSLALEQLRRAETYALFLCSVMGALIVINAYHFMLMYLGVELMSLPIYAMIALRANAHGAQAAEASLKYFFLGAFASALLLYGFSLMYGATGTLSLLNFEAGFGNAYLLILGFCFVMAGMAFKLSLVPFHMWAPDVYQGAPTFLTLFISTVPKIAATVLLLRLIGYTELLAPYWQQTLATLAVLSMILGGVVAVAQTNIKRMLAYSTIGHMGYLLLGAMIASIDGLTAAIFYVLTYVTANLVAFGVLLISTSEQQPLENLDDFRGLAKRAPLRAGLMTLAMLSLAGVPPLVGFFGKFSVIEVAWNNGFTGLSVVAIVTSVIAAFYYLRLIATMLFKDAEGVVASQPLSAGPVATMLLTLNGIALLFLGVFPQTLLNPIAEAVSSLLRFL